MVELHMVYSLFKAASSEFDIGGFRLVGKCYCHSGLFGGFFCIFDHWGHADQRIAAKFGNSPALPVMKLHSRREIACACFNIAHCILRLLGSLECSRLQFYLSLDMDD